MLSVSAAVGQAFRGTRSVLQTGCAIGIAESYCWENPKPAEFGSAGQNWENIGWKVRVRFHELLHRVQPKDHIDVLRALLPAKYGPLQPNGDGKQGIYLTNVDPSFAEVLAGLIGPEAQPFMQGQVLPVALAPMQVGDDLDYWEYKLEHNVIQDLSITETDRQAIVRARLGQGLLKTRVLEIENRCRLTGVDRVVHLVASHCKPWRDASNEERLDGENGLLLTPSIDHLFDRGFISFENSGLLIVSPVAHHASLQRMGIETERTVHAGAFTEGQRRYLEFHRTDVLLKSIR